MAGTTYSSAQFLVAGELDPATSDNPSSADRRAFRHWDSGGGVAAHRALAAGGLRRTSCRYARSVVCPCPRSWCCSFAWHLRSDRVLSVSLLSMCVNSWLAFVNSWWWPFRLAFSTAHSLILSASRNWFCSICGLYKNVISNSSGFALVWSFNFPPEAQVVCCGFFRLLSTSFGSSENETNAVFRRSGISDFVTVPFPSD